VLDEFHERSIHADVALALARQAWLARRDLRLVVMSATLDAAAVAGFLGGCPVIRVPGRAHPVDVSYAPAHSLGAAVADALRQTPGDVLAFLPGAPEIDRAAADLGPLRGQGIELVPLHGSLPAAAQDRVFTPGDARRVILATNVAETSITVPRVTGVVDSGLHKVARYDAGRAVDSLDLERIPQDAADQRSGRAGRLSPGTAIRLWDARARLRPHREAEITRIDLSATVLDVRAWGGDPRTLEWFEAPSPTSIEAAEELLGRLGALDGGAVTDTGRRLQVLPLHPRLGRILLDARGAWEASLACAVLSERGFLPDRTEATTSDLLAAIDGVDRLPRHVVHVARQIQQIAQRVLGRDAREHVEENAFRRAVLAGYPDRVARRRAPASPRLILASGHGAVLHRSSGVVEGEFLVALDVQSGRAGAGSEARVRLASRVERAWLQDTQVTREHRLDEAAGGIVRALDVERYGQIVVGEHPAPADPAVTARLLADAYVKRDPSEQDVQLARRLSFAGLPVSFPDLVTSAAARARTLDEISPHSALSGQTAGALDRLAPLRLTLPSGRSAQLEYHDDGSVSLSAKLQELFGLAETPRLGPRRTPVRVTLLAPNGRPVQTTTDLRSFWTRTYADVRKELRGRYPKHPWPEDPWNATPTHRATRRSPR
jgi:ATP-dependent helicase HrpB